MHYGGMEELMLKLPRCHRLWPLKGLLVTIVDPDHFECSNQCLEAVELGKGKALSDFRHFANVWCSSKMDG